MAMSRVSRKLEFQRFGFRVWMKTWRRLKHDAEREGVTVSRLVNRILQEYYRAADAQDRGPRVN